MSLVIGDTPEQLGSCLTADAVMIDGKIKAERDAALAQVESQLDDRKAFVKKEFELLKEVERLEIELKKRDEQNAALAAQVKELKSELRQEKLIHIGFTNESQVQYVTEDKEEGAFYPNSDNGCYIPVYMLNVHAHRVGPNSKIYCTQLEQGKKIAEIRAEAVLDAVKFFAPALDIETESLEWYAAKVRQGGAA